jgi:hypothetical protein
MMWMKIFYPDTVNPKRLTADLLQAKPSPRIHID